MNLIFTASDITGLDETRDLWSWLRQDDDLRSGVDLRPGPPVAETMGAEYVIGAVVTVLPLITRAVLRYLEVRRRGTDLVLTVTTATGEKREIKVDRSLDPVELTKLMLRESGRDDDASSRP